MNARDFLSAVACGIAAACLVALQRMPQLLAALREVGL